MSGPETVEKRRTRVHATVIATPAAVAGLRDQFGTAVIVVRATSDGRLEVRIGGGSRQMIAEQLAAWGAAIDVIAPAAVRRQLPRIGAELVAAHGATVTRASARRAGRPPAT